MKYLIVLLFLCSNAAFAWGEGEGGNEGGDVIVDNSNDVDVDVDVDQEQWQRQNQQLNNTNDLTANGGAGGRGGQGGAGGEANNSLNDVGNSNSKSSVKLEYPMKLSFASLGRAQQCDGIYQQYNGLSKEADNGIKILFITEAYSDVIGIAMRQATVINDASEQGLPWVASRFLPGGGNYRGPVNMALKMADKAPDGTRTMVAYVSTICHTISSGLAATAGQAAGGGWSEMFGGSTGGAATIPAANISVTFFEEDIIIDESAL